MIQMADLICWLYTVGGGYEPEEVSFLATNADYMYECKDAIQYFLFGLGVLFLLQLALAGRQYTGKYLQIFDFLVGAVGTAATTYLTYNPLWEDYIINSIQWYSVVLACYAFAISWMNRKSERNDCNPDTVCRERYGFYVASVLAVAVSFIFFARTMNSRNGSFLNRLSWMNRGNVKAYALMLILLVVIFLILMLLLKKIFCDAKEIFLDRNALYALLLLFFSCISGFVFYGNEGKKYNIVLWVIFFAVVFLCIYKCILQYSNHQGDIAFLAKTKISNRVCFFVYGIVIIASSLKQTIINCWGRGFSDIYHAHWYFGRIPYVVNGDAFSGGIVDVYGHYGLWYKYLMDIFGHNSLIMGIIFGIVNAITVSIFLYLIHKVTENMNVRLCGAVVIGIFSIVGRLYPMTLTGRLFIVAITLFFIIQSVNFIKKDCSIKKICCIEIMGVIVGIFNVISSTDVGIISNGVWALTISMLMTYVTVRDKKVITMQKKILTLIGEMAFHIVMLTVQIFGAYVIIKIWNYNHADISFYNILKYAGEFNISSAGYDQNNKFIFHNSMWIYILILLMILFLWKLKVLLVYFIGNRKEFDIKDIVHFSLSVMSLGMFVFYVSRPEDFLCIGDLFAVCVCLLADKAVVLLNSTQAKNEKSMTCEELISRVLLAGCVLVFTIGFFNVGNAAKNEYDYIVRYHQLDWRGLTDEFERFRQEVPENTYVLDNIGLSLVYMNIGREMPDSMENCDYIICAGLNDDIDVNVEYIKSVSVDAISYDLYRIVR